MESRKQFQGVLNILSFNRHFYFAGLAFLAGLITTSLLLKWPTELLWVFVAIFIYGFIMPLLVSAYVYDFSGYYNLNWLNSQLEKNAPALQIVNINAGFDETSFILEKKFPNCNLKVFDFYNARQHTEPAIKRARKVSMVYPDTKQIASDLLPLNNQSVDYIFLLSAAHEIRSHEEKIVFLKECNRLCRAGGKVIMVEHLRDFPNFLAFSIGFWHFFSRSTWKKAFASAGFSGIEETKFTPFMSIFTCSR